MSDAREDMDWTEQEIAAFVDGELDAVEAARIAAILDADPAARARAEELRAMNALLRDAFAAPLEEPAPAPMRAALLGAPGKVATLTPAARRAPRTWAPAALAASVALLIGLGVGGALFGPSPQAPQVAQAALGVGLAPEAAQAALETAPSGAEQGALRLLASFETPGGACREFETLGAGASVEAMGLACRSAEGWRVLTLAQAAEGETTDGGYAPASGAALDAIGAALDALGAGPALSPEQEASRIGSGWR
ncbi:MAG: hypothetical protein ACFCUS_12575 [Rubrimonas sp.]|uniref:hypothetical protein n=1 Tax=Rubrimonas sp. TaxID=2036015 RepID=UPI002FDD2E76